MALGKQTGQCRPPQGASISDAYVQFQVDETPSGTTSLTIEGKATDNAVTFGTSTGDISSRSRTSAAVLWAPAPWPNVGDAGLAQRTPNLAAVIQELVDRSGWASGNALVIIITGTGERVAESFNGFQPPRRRCTRSTVTERPRDGITWSRLRTPPGALTEHGTNHPTVLPSCQRLSSEVLSLGMRLAW
jgi:hypothetical protein